METNKDLEMEITGNYKTLHVKTTKTLKMTTPSVVFFFYFMNCTFSFCSDSTNDFTALDSEQFLNSNI